MNTILDNMLNKDITIILGDFNFNICATHCMRLVVEILGLGERNESRERLEFLPAKKSFYNFTRGFCLMAESEIKQILSKSVQDGNPL